ncbi:MAG: membrane protein insertion efficiency factor YidD [Polaromonas sp.]|nr:membrane protein insertion efficiency factor YidD [Polaromonas sp.]
MTISQGLVRIASTLPSSALIGLIRAYRLLLSPWLGSACRFEPSCSAYGLGAIEKHGAAVGSALTLRRLARCHPWCEGGLDPVPSSVSHLFFTRLVARATGSSAEKNAS